MTGALWVGVAGDITTTTPHPTTAQVMLPGPVTTLAIGGLNITTGDHPEPNPVVTFLTATITGQLVHLYGPALIAGPAFTPLPQPTMNTLATHLTRIRVHHSALLERLAGAAQIAHHWTPRPGGSVSTTWSTVWTERTPTP